VNLSEEASSRVFILLSSLQLPTTTVYIIIIASSTLGRQKVTMRLPAVIALLYVSAVAGFATPGAPKRETSLHMTRPQEALKRAAVSAVAAAFLASNLATAEPAFALDMDFGTSQIVAGRTGGRAGGRSTAARAPTSSSSTTHVIHRTTYVQPSPVIVAPAPVYSYGYNPLPGLGTFQQD